MTDDLVRPGDTLWHTSDPDGGGGPDVGIEVRLSATQRLYAGELPGYPGWSIALYNGADRVVIASDVHSAEARDMIDAIGLSIRRAPDTIDALRRAPDVGAIARATPDELLDEIGKRLQNTDPDVAPWAVKWADDIASAMLGAEATPKAIGDALRALAQDKAEGE